MDQLTLDRQAMKDPATANLRIYVGGLTDKANPEDLLEHFKEYGNIQGIVVNRLFGFVQFEEESSAQAAIEKANGSSLLGKNIVVKTAQTNSEKKVREVVEVVQADVPPAVALSDNLPVEETEDQYDSYGNFIGDKSKSNPNFQPVFAPNYGGEEYEEQAPGFNNRAADFEGGFANDYVEEFEEHVPYNNRGRGRGGPRGRGGRGRGGRGRGMDGGSGGMPPMNDFREPPPVVPPPRPEWQERNPYDRYAPPPEYPRALPVPERNDCEIIVVSKLLTEYAEYIETRLKRLGIVVDLLFPMEDVPIGKVLGNIASRGCLYSILVMPQNQEHRSITLTILHGLPQEHRNMPLEDALQLLSRNFQEVQRGGPGGREAVYALLGQLADGRSLTVMQYDKVMEYLQERREQQVKIEVGGEPPNSAPNKTQADLQQRILSILNEKTAGGAAPAPAPLDAVPVQNQQLLNNPSVRKALDSILKTYA